jgi:hypothetical protein
MSGGNLNKNHGISAVIFVACKNAYTTDLLIALMHLVHSTLWITRPFSITIVFCKFGLNLRLVARWENERLCPNAVDLPQFAHLAMTYDFLSLL